MTREDQLMTLIDWLNCEKKRSQWSFGVGGALVDGEFIAEAHDIGHVVLGGDRTLEQWRFCKMFLGLAPMRDIPELADVQDRMKQVIEANDA